MKVFYWIAIALSLPYWVYAIVFCYIMNQEPIYPLSLYLFWMAFAGLVILGILAYRKSSLKS